MTSVACFALRVAASPACHRASGGFDSILKALFGGSLIVASGVAVVIAVITGFGWVLAGSLDARSDMRLATLRPPAVQFALAPSADAVGAPLIASVQPYPQQRALAAPRWMRHPLGAIAMVMHKPSDDRLVTGSLGSAAARVATRLAARVAAPLTAREMEPAILHVQPPLPLPRPRLASLTPPDVTVLKPDIEIRSRRTAIYDIAAKVVYLPSGERLEAHSGLGRFMDDPSSMRERNRGVTPPGTYDLKLRESLFHGVQAIRLTPVNEEIMFGRDGILAHSYMLGPSGQSNGCVSFKDYERFLRAYQNGEIDRIVVVPGLHKPPSYASRADFRSADNLPNRDNVF